MRKLTIPLVVFSIAALVGISFLGGPRTSLARTGTNGIPSYSGFEQIDSAKKHFIVIGDTQSTGIWAFWRERNDTERKLIIDEIARREPAFVVHLGDLTGCGSSSRQWQLFDDLHKEFRVKKIPYFPILGNHEFWGNEEIALQNYFGRFPHLSEQRWYSFKWKKVGFILADSNFSRLTVEEIEMQKKWYIDQLKGFEKDEKINSVVVCCHESPFTNSRVIGPSQKVKAAFADPFLRYAKTRLFFSGHNHSYERFQFRGKFFVVSGGGGGPRFKVTIRPERRRYEDLFSGSEVRFLHFIEIENIDSSLGYRVVPLNRDGTFAVTDPFDVMKPDRD